MGNLTEIFSEREGFVRAIPGALPSGSHTALAAKRLS